MERYNSWINFIFKNAIRIVNTHDFTHADLEIEIDMDRDKEIDRERDRNRNRNRQNRHRWTDR